MLNYRKHAKDAHLYRNFCFKRFAYFNLYTLNRKLTVRKFSPTSPAYLLRWFVRMDKLGPRNPQTEWLTFRTYTIYSEFLLIQSKHRHPAILGQCPDSTEQSLIFGYCRIQYTDNIGQTDYFTCCSIVRKQHLIWASNITWQNMHVAFHYFSPLRSHHIIRSNVSMAMQRLRNQPVSQTRNMSACLGRWSIGQGSNEVSGSSSMWD